MPKLNDTNLQNFSGGHFGYSGTKMVELEKIGNQFSLANIVVDDTGSIFDFKDKLEFAIKESIRALQLSPRANNILVRVTAFSTSINNNLQEIHGWRLLSSINLDDYSGILSASGFTPLNDATIDGLDAINNYATECANQNIDTNAILIVITDGEENRSKFGIERVVKAKTDCIKNEALESIVSLLVGVNIQDARLAGLLNDFKVQGKFDQFEKLEDASQKSIARLVGFISKSVSLSSQSLGSGGPSQAIISGSLTI